MLQSSMSALGAPLMPADGDPTIQLAPGRRVGCCLRRTGGLGGCSGPSRPSSGWLDRIFIAKLCCMLPSVVSWGIVLWAKLFGTALAIDSNGVAHTVHLGLTYNFMLGWYFNATFCGCACLFHLWLTLIGIAEEYKLDQSGNAPLPGSAADGTAVTYSERMTAAGQGARTLSRMEVLHLSLFTADLLFASFVVFQNGFTPGNTGQNAQDGVLDHLDWLVGLAPPLLIAMVCTLIARSRAAIIRTQRAQVYGYALFAAKLHGVVMVLHGLQLIRYWAWQFWENPIGPRCVIEYRDCYPLVPALDWERDRPTRTTPTTDFDYATWTANTCYAYVSNCVSCVAYISCVFHFSAPVFGAHIQCMNAWPLPAVECHLRVTGCRDCRQRDIR